MYKYLILGISSLYISSAIAQESGALESDSGLYLGANYGYLKIDSEDDFDFDDDSDALQGLLGYRFNPYLSLEGSYIDFGDYGGDIGDVSTDGYTFAVKGGLPLTNSFALYAKLGQLWWEAEYDTPILDGKQDDQGLFYGAGASFDITKSFVVNVQYNWYDLDLSAKDVVDSEDIDEVDFDTNLEHLAVGLEYRF